MNLEELKELLDFATENGLLQSPFDVVWDYYTFYKNSWLIGVFKSE